MRQIAWYDAFIWLIFTAVGFLGPLLLGILFGAAFGKDLSLDLIAGGGQFAVSSTGLLMTTSYFVVKPGASSRLPLTEWFMILSVIGLFLGIALFILVTLTRSGVSIDSAYYSWPSIGLFVMALIIAFIAVGLDRTRVVEKANFLEQRSRAERTKIDKDFDATF